MACRSPLCEKRYVHVCLSGRLAAGRSTGLWRPGFVSQIENYWDQPDLARWLLSPGHFERVVIFDNVARAFPIHSVAPVAGFAQ